MTTDLLKDEKWLLETPLLEKAVTLSPRRDLSEFLRTFDGPIFNGPHAFAEAYHTVWNDGKPCVVIIKSQGWWCYIDNKRQWIEMLKLKQETDNGN